MTATTRVELLRRTGALGTAVPLFELPSGLAAGAGLGDYAVTTNGQRFLVNLSDPSAPNPIMVTLNWSVALKT